MARGVEESRFVLRTRACSRRSRWRRGVSRAPTRASCAGAASSSSAMRHAAGGEAAHERAAGGAQPPASERACPLAELVQYHCQLQTRKVVCLPVERVFRMCPRRPAVEVTHLVEYDASGRPYLPECMACVASAAQEAWLTEQGCYAAVQRVAGRSLARFPGHELAA